MSKCGRLHDRKHRQQLPYHNTSLRPAYSRTSYHRDTRGHGRTRGHEHSAPTAPAVTDGHGDRAAAGDPAMDRSRADPGLTLAASGFTPARRISARTSPAWAGLCTVITTPSA